MEEQNYTCQRCGACCRWEGQVRVTAEEITAIAALLGIAESDFIQHRTRLSSDRKCLALLDKPNGECEFLKDGTICTIEAAKPRQCRDFPDLWNLGAKGICRAMPCE